MANEEETRRPNLEPDLPDDLARIAREVDRPFGAVFAGLLVDDDHENYVRLYQDYELQTYLRIAREDILHRQRAMNRANAEISILRVRKEATVEIREVQSEVLQADTLSAALREAETAMAAEFEETVVAKTPATIPISIRFCSRLVCTRVFCTNITCGCTSRHTLICTIFAHPGADR